MAFNSRGWWLSTPEVGGFQLPRLVAKNRPKWRLVLPVIRKERVKLIPVRFFLAAWSLRKNRLESLRTEKPVSENKKTPESIQLESLCEKEIHSELAFCLSYVIFIKLMSPPKYKIIENVMAQRKGNHSASWQNPHFDKMPSIKNRFAHLGFRLYTFST